MEPPKIENPKFFEILKKKNIIPEEFISDLLDELQGNALDVLATLIQSGAATKRKLCQIWCDSIGIAHVDLEKSLFQPDIVRKIPENFARKYYTIPLYKLGEKVTVASATPNNELIKEELEKIIGDPVNLVFALPQDIAFAIEDEYKTSNALYDFFSKIAASKAFAKEDNLTEAKLQQIAGPESINQFHVCLVLYGVTENASEIQIDPMAGGAKINFIINETFKERFQIDNPIYEHLTTKLKQMAKIDPDKKNEAQYSRLLFPSPGKKFDIQLLTLPTDLGERLYIKLMDRMPLKGNPALTEQYISTKHLRAIKQQIDALQGVMLISGPPKSGKTTLAYSVLKELRLLKLQKLLTVEDNVKWLLKDVDQYQVNEKAGFNAQAALESCIKQHPKAIYIQNIDNPDIIGLIDQALEANIFIIAGIGATDAFDALNKVIHLGIIHSISLIINQNFVSRLCDHCKEQYAIPDDEIEKYFIWDGKTEVFAYRETGCTYCRHTGFFDKVCIQELLPIGDDILQMIDNKATTLDIIGRSRQIGFESKEYDGFKKILRGLTNFEEIEKIST